MSADVDAARAALLEALAGNRDAPVLDRLNDFEAAVDGAARAEAYRQGYDSAVYDAEAKLRALREADWERLFMVARYGEGVERLDVGPDNPYRVAVRSEARVVRAALAATPAEEEQTWTPCTDPTCPSAHVAHEHDSRGWYRGPEARPFA